MACAENPSGEYAPGLLQYSKVTTLVEVLSVNSSLTKQIVSMPRSFGHQDSLLNVAAHAARQMTEVSSLNHSAFGELGVIGLFCLLVSLMVMVICMTTFLLAKQSPSTLEEKKPATCTHISSSSRILSSSRLDLATPILAVPDDDAQRKGLLLTVRKSAQGLTTLTPGIDVIDAGGLHLLHFMPGPPDRSGTSKGACCTLHVGAGGPLLATVEVGGGAAEFRDSKGKTVGRLEAIGTESYALDGLGSCKCFLRGVFRDRSVIVTLKSVLVASTEVRPGLPDSTRPLEPDVIVCVAPGMDAGLILCAALAADWLEAALQGRNPRAPWGCAFPDYFRHRLSLVADQAS